MSAILTLTGVSGSGKTTVAGELLRLRPDIRMIPSVTTRGRRESDLPNEYEYVNQEAFDFQKSAGFFLWHVTRGDVSYGTDRNAVFDFCDRADGIGIMILVPSKVHELAEFVRGQYGLAVPVIPVYLIPPSREILRERLRARGETPECIEERLQLERNWGNEAVNSPETFHFINGGETMKELPHVVEEITKHLHGL